MPNRCNRGFYCRSYCLLNMFWASPCPSSGAQEYYTVVAASGISCCGFSSSWSGVELRVMCPVCRMLQHPANRTCVEIHSDDPPIISSAYGVSLDSRVLDKILYAVGKSDMPLLLLKSVLAPLL